MCAVDGVMWCSVVLIIGFCKAMFELKTLNCHRGMASLVLRPSCPPYDCRMFGLLSTSLHTMNSCCTERWKVPAHMLLKLAWSEMYKHSAHAGTVCIAYIVCFMYMATYVCISNILTTDPFNEVYVCSRSHWYRDVVATQALCTRPTHATPPSAPDPLTPLPWVHQTHSRHSPLQWREWYEWVWCTRRQWQTGLR